jgi:type II secretion system protein H
VEALKVRGFTLLEVLVVVAIIAVCSSLLILAMPGEAALADKEARRLAALVEAATVEARASGQPIAWTAERTGYSFWQRSEEGEWQRFPEQSPYHARAFGGAISIDGAAVTLMPYGLQAPFEAVIRAGGTQIILRSGALGRVSLERLHAS